MTRTINLHITDPTVRYKTGLDQPVNIDVKKKRIYKPTINYLKKTTVVKEYILLVSLFDHVEQFKHFEVIWTKLKLKSRFY